MVFNNRLKNFTMEESQIVGAGGIQHVRNEPLQKIPETLASARNVAVHSEKHQSSEWQDDRLL